jgi:YD repeat-containing protein
MTAGDLYRIVGSGYGAWGSSANGTQAQSSLLGGPMQLAFDGNGDLFIADSDNDRIVEVAATSHSQWGLSMSAGDVYTVAGSAGSAGTPSNGESASAAVLNQPYGIALDSSGDMVIANSEDNLVNFVAASSCASSCPWGLGTTTADDIYTIVGNGGQSSPSCQSNLAATSTGLDWPSAVALDTSGDVLVADSGNNRILERPVSSGTHWGQSMTAGDAYTIAGACGGNSGYSGDGGVATSALFANLASFSVAPSGSLYLTDTSNNALRVVTATTSGTKPSPSAPSGYSLVTSVTSGSTTTYLYDHEVTSGDTAATIAYSGTGPETAVLASYANLSPTSPIDASSSGSASGTSVGAPSVTTTHPGDTLVVVSGIGQQGGKVSLTMPAGSTVRAAANGLVSAGESLADLPGPAHPGSTGTETTTSPLSGQLTSILLALSPGSVTSTTTYDADDEAVLTTDPDNNSTLTCRDGDGNVVETVPPTGVKNYSLGASSCGTSSSTLYPNGYIGSSGSEALPLSLASDATLDAYDPSGNKVIQVTPAPAGQSGTETTTYAYDAAGQLSSMTGPPADNGGLNQVTSYQYDSDGRVTEMTTGSGGASSITLYCYDANGNRTAVVAPDGNTPTVQTCINGSTSSSYQTTYSYDSAGELISQVTPATSAAPSGQRRLAIYDAAGNLVSTTDPDNVTTTSTYSPLGEPASVTYSGNAAHSVTYSHDADGQLSATSDASGTSSYSYDPFGELTSATNGAGKTLSYRYDSLGQTTDVTYPLGSVSWAATPTVHEAYDEAGHLASLTDFEGNTIAISDTADGIPDQMTLGSSGESVVTSYDSTDSPSSIELNGTGGTLLGFSYSDTPAGNVSQESDTPSVSYSPASYHYDIQSRVTSDTPGSRSTLNYTEDASGNLTTLPTGAGTTYNDASELTSSSLSGTTTSYSYNADGERTQQSQGSTTTVSASYNGAEELTAYSDASADMTSATYDGNGLRSSDTVGSSTQGFVWDARGSVPELLMDGTNAYIYAGGNAPSEQVNLATGAVSYLVSDALGSVRGVVSSAGALSASTAYDAWGNPETSGGLSSYTPFGFAGGYTDPTGLVYLIHRYYGKRRDKPARRRR